MMLSCLQVFHTLFCHIRGNWSHIAVKKKKKRFYPKWCVLAYWLYSNETIHHSLWEQASSHLHNAEYFPPTMAEWREKDAFVLVVSLEFLIRDAGLFSHFNKLSWMEIQWIRNVVDRLLAGFLVWWWSDQKRVQAVTATRSEKGRLRTVALMQI